jgi:hypothetical protein
MAGLVVGNISGSTDVIGDGHSTIGLTGSLIIKNSTQDIDFTSVVGTDTVFYVSGTQGTLNEDDGWGSAVFGGDVMISGALRIGDQVTAQEADSQDNKSVIVNSVNKGGILKIDASEDTVGFFDGDEQNHAITGEDIHWYVSGSASNKNNENGAVAVFGGNVVISGTLYDGDGDSIAGGGPAGSDTQLQYNNGGSMGGLAKLTWDDTNFLLGASATTKLQIRDSGIFINSPSDGDLQISSDGTAEDAIKLVCANSAGGIDIDCGTTGYNTTTTGHLALTSSLNHKHAVQLLASAGGMEFKAAGAAGEDIDITNAAGSIIITAGEDVDSCIYIHADAGTSETINIHSDQGTGASAATESDASVQLESDAGGIGLLSKLDAVNAIRIEANGGTSENIVIHANQGTAATEGAASIQLLSDDGGINIKSGLDGANAILLTADGGTSETIVLHADQGNGDASIKLLSDAGGITLQCNSSKNVTVTGGGLLPAADNSQDLGSASKRWENVYTGDLHLQNDRGNWTMIEEPTFLSLRNNDTGKRYKLLMEELPGGTYGPGANGEL